MAKANRKTARVTTPVSLSLMHSVTTPDMVNHEGAPAYSRDSRSALFLLASSNFVGEETFYENASDRDERFATLAKAVAVNDGLWFAPFVKWLRSEGNMRSAPLEAVVHGVQARLSLAPWERDLLRRDGEAEPNHRQMVTSVLQRADEPGELVAIWEREYGQAWEREYGQTQENGQKKARLPMSFKRGIADALLTLYTEFSALKYDTPSHAKRFGDVLELTHAVGGNEYRDQLYTWLLDRRHGRDGDKDYPLLTMVMARRVLSAVPQADRVAYLAGDHQAEFKAAGVTWEWLSSWLGSALDAGFWETMIPTMAYMALIRNLRNFDKAEISEDLVNSVVAKLGSKEQVAKSRQFPYRFLSAYEATESSDRWRTVLSKALTHSTQNIPELPGRTLILIDVSGSMGSCLSQKSTRTYADVAAVLGITLAHRNKGRVDVYGFATTHFKHDIKPTGAVLNEVTRFTKRLGEVGYGTEVVEALKATWDNHDRVIILSDEQTMSGRVGEQVPAHVPIYAFNVAGYESGMLPLGHNRYQLGGVTDATFRMIPNLEAGMQAHWPWEDQD